jgi:Tol biopolymer transport system component
MMKRVHWLWLIVTLVVIGVVPVSRLDASTAKSVTYHNPLAYIGLDGNIYLTDLNSGVGTAVTNDVVTSCPDGSTPSPSDDYKPLFLRHYRNIRWSPVGGAFTFGVEPDIACLPVAQPSIFLVRSNSRPQHLIDWGEQPFSEPIGTWSPDGTQIAYLDANGIGVVPLANNTPHHVVDYSYQPCIGDGPGVDDLTALFSDEEGNPDPYIDPAFSLDWTVPGFLVPVNNTDIGATTCSSLELLNQNGIVWTAEGLSSPLVSPNGKQALDQSAGDQLPDGGFAVTTVLIDLASGTLTPLPFIPGPQVWTPDGKQILYTTVEPNSQRSDESKVSLWSVPVHGGAATRLLTRVGYGIGVITPSPDGKGPAFSLVTSTPVGATPSNPKVAAGIDHIELLYVDFATHGVKRIALGRWPSFGTGDFTALPAK